jgi:hypothetical protein
MPTQVYDASLLTQRRRNYAIYTYNRLNSSAVAAGTSVRREQPDMQLQTVVTYRHEVAANKAPAAECPCAEAVDRNAGGGNASNVQ